jgi:alkylation response protein AidB-like acyl-CoA dehydrogenase
MSIVPTPGRRAAESPSADLAFARLVRLVALSAETRRRTTMTTIAQDPATAAQLLERVGEISPLIGERAAEAEEMRRLPRPVVDAMLEAGLYRMSRPKAFGGLEVDPITIFRVVEEVARHDSAAAWNLQLSLAANCMLAWLPDEGAAEVLEGHPSTIIATSFTLGRRAKAVDGGYRLSGQWPFVSGSHDCQWLFFIPDVVDDDEPRLNDDGSPVQRFMYLPTDQAEILDTWHTLGMRGTGSDDVAVSDVFVPEHHTALHAPLEKPGTAYRGPLYQLTVWVPIGLLVPPALGIARAAIDGLLEMAGAKTPSFTGSSLGQRQVVQRQVAEAEATLGAGRAYLYETFRESWEMALQGAEITLDQKRKMQLAMTHGVICAAKAVDLVHTAAGSSSIRNEHKFQQHFRDVHTITQHAFVSASRHESAGQLMLGLETDWGFFAM